MKRIIALLLLIAAPSYAAWVIFFDVPTGRNLRRLDVAETLNYYGQSNVLVMPDLPTNALSQCYVTNGTVQVIPQSWLDAEALAAWIAQSNAVVLNTWLERSNNIHTAKNVVNGTDAPSRLVRWQTLLILDQINTLRKSASLPIITTNTLVNALSNAIVNDAL